MTIDGNKEELPGTLFEAMAAGLAVISTNHAGIHSVVQNGITGILVNEWDVEGLKKAIHLFWLNPEQRKTFGNAAQKSAIENADIVSKEVELENIYSTLHT